MKLLPLLWLAITVTDLQRASAASPDTLDLSDCRILSGKLHAKAYKGVIDRVRKEAATGDLEARKVLAAVAANKFACRLEDYSDGAGWTTIMSSSGSGGDDKPTSTSTEVVPMDALLKDPVALKELKDAYRSAHDLADEDVGYRQMAAGYVANYKAAFKEEYADAYRDAFGAREAACRYPEAIPGKSSKKTLCTMARSSTAALYTLLDKDQRDRLEQEAGVWLEQFVRKAKAR